MPRPGEDRSDVGGAAQFNNIGPVPLSASSRFLLPQVPKKAATSAFVKSRGCRLPWNKMNRVVQATESFLAAPPTPEGRGLPRRGSAVSLRRCRRCPRGIARLRVLWRLRHHEGICRLGERSFGLQVE